MTVNDFADTDMSEKVSEPVMAYGNINAHRHIPLMETFEQQWQRALSVEDFRERCKHKIHVMYE